ncbi:hypothetical protein [Almyronema epifaneia]|uniref:Uncharacterized protein n=1 Tax=Almyronema epifaneia S1 TaxID=2991925 RepID=A0ABW6IIS6_9CYAN
MTDSPRSARQLSPLTLPIDDKPEILRVIAIGSLLVVNDHVLQMYQRHYAAIHEWSGVLPIPDSDKVMRILTKRVMGLGDR